MPPIIDVQSRLPLRYDLQMRRQQSTVQASKPLDPKPLLDFAKRSLSTAYRQWRCGIGPQAASLRSGLMEFQPAREQPDSTRTKTRVPAN